jgi:hypothetical protein
MPKWQGHRPTRSSALGDDDLILVVPGEAAEFSNRTPHWTGAVDGPAEAPRIFGPQGERVHLRARR